MDPVIDVRALGEQVKARLDTEPEFVERVRPIMTVVDTMSPGRDRSVATGAALMAAHLLDIADGRWTP